MSSSGGFVITPISTGRLSALMWNYQCRHCKILGTILKHSISDRWRCAIISISHVTLTTYCFCWHFALPWRCYLPTKTAKCHKIGSSLPIISPDPTAVLQTYTAQTKVTSGFFGALVTPSISTHAV